MKHLFFTLICTCIILTSISCAGKEIEEDKHPEIPYFPETTNDEINFQKLAHNPFNFYKIDSTFIREKKYHDIYILMKMN